MRQEYQRLEYLALMIHRYSHRWCDEPSKRLSGWVEEYCEIKRNLGYLAWDTFCNERGLDRWHDGYDCLA
jgi:hypothetical protein